MLGVFTNSKHHFGLPERSSSFLLSETGDGDSPYRLYAIDVFPHLEWNSQGLYSGIPYITGHTATHDGSLLWVNAAETWVDIIGYQFSQNSEGRVINFISESGVLELFLFASAVKDSPKRVARKLATISGYQSMPPFYALGFHYSKWDRQTSANEVMT